MWRCDLDKPCVKFCESKNDKASCGMQYKRKNMFEVLDEVCKPERGSKYSSCVDLFAREDVVIGAGETKVIPLGVKIDTKQLKAISNRDMENTFGMNIEDIPMPDGDEDDVYFDCFMTSHCLELKCRSSLPLKKGLIIANGVGEIDLDYPDEIGILLHNPISFEHRDNNVANILMLKDGTEIKKGEKIAQIKLVEHKSYLFGIESNKERYGGFGSTDCKHENTSPGADGYDVCNECGVKR